MHREQYSHEPNVATLRFWRTYLGQPLTPEQEGVVPGKQAAGEAALRLMDEHLGRSDWFVGSGVTLADIALYAYTHVAEEGGFPLRRYPNVQAWLARVAALSGYVAMHV